MQCLLNILSVYIVLRVLWCNRVGWSANHAWSFEVKQDLCVSVWGVASWRGSSGPGRPARRRRLLRPLLTAVGRQSTPPPPPPPPAPLSVVVCWCVPAAGCCGRWRRLALAWQVVGPAPWIFFASRFGTVSHSIYCQCNPRFRSCVDDPV